MSKTERGIGMHPQSGGGEVLWTPSEEETVVLQRRGQKTLDLLREAQVDYKSTEDVVEYGEDGFVQLEATSNTSASKPVNKLLFKRKALFNY